MTPTVIPPMPNVPYVADYFNGNGAHSDLSSDELIQMGIADFAQPTTNGADTPNLIEGEVAAIRRSFADLRQTFDQKAQSSKRIFLMIV